MSGPFIRGGLTPDLYRVNQRFRRALLERDRGAALEILAEYRRAYGAIAAALEALTDQIERARRDGVSVSPSWLFRQGRLATLQEQAHREIALFARVAEQIVEREQREAVLLSIEHAAGFVETQLPAGYAGVTGGFKRLASGAMRELIGFSADGSPLADLFGTFGPISAERIRAALVTGLALGYSPRQIATNVSRAMSGNLARALTIARTETMRAYRESQRRTYQANPRLVKGWRWFSALDRRTCPACWAQHGTFHRLDDVLDGHPGCRCTMLPETTSSAELGLGEVDASVSQLVPGTERFAALDEVTQREILGPGKFAAYRDGRITLEDLVRRRSNRRWGTMRSEASLAQALESAAKS